MASSAGNGSGAPRCTWCGRNSAGTRRIPDSSYYPATSPASSAHRVMTSSSSRSLTGSNDDNRPSLIPDPQALIVDRESSSFILDGCLEIEDEGFAMRDPGSGIRD